MSKMARRRAPALALAVLVLLLCAAVDPDSVAAADSAASDDESLDYDDPLHIHAQHARQAVGGGRSGGGSSSAADLLKLGDLPDGYHYPGASSHRDRDLHQDPQRERVYERLRASEGLYCAVCHAVARHLASEVRPHVLDGVPLTLEQAEQYAAAACGPPQSGPIPRMDPGESPEHLISRLSALDDEDMPDYEAPPPWSTKYDAPVMKNGLASLFRRELRLRMEPRQRHSARYEMWQRMRAACHTVMSPDVVEAMGVLLYHRTPYLESELCKRMTDFCSPARTRHHDLNHDEL